MWPPHSVNRRSHAVRLQRPAMWSAAVVRNGSRCCAHCEAVAAKRTPRIRLRRSAGAPSWSGRRRRLGSHVSAHNTRLPCAYQRSIIGCTAASMRLRLILHRGREKAVFDRPRLRARPRSCAAVRESDSLAVHVMQQLLHPRAAPRRAPRARRAAGARPRPAPPSAYASGPGPRRTPARELQSQCARVEAVLDRRRRYVLALAVLNSSSGAAGDLEQPVGAALVPRGRRCERTHPR